MTNEIPLGPSKLKAWTQINTVRGIGVKPEVVLIIPMSCSRCSCTIPSAQREFGLDAKVGWHVDVLPSVMEWQRGVSRTTIVLRQNSAAPRSECLRIYTHTRVAPPG